MSYENEIQTYILDLEKNVEDLQKQVSLLQRKLEEARRLISILDTQQQHVDF